MRDIRLKLTQININSNEQRQISNLTRRQPAVLSINVVQITLFRAMPATETEHKLDQNQKQRGT